MVLERDKHVWRHTGSLMAMYANCHSSKHKFKPSDFDPYAPKATLDRIKASELAKMWGITNVRIIKVKRKTDVSSN